MNRKAITVVGVLFVVGILLFAYTNTRVVDETTSPGEYTAAGFPTVPPGYDIKATVRRAIGVQVMSLRTIITAVYEGGNVRMTTSEAPALLGLG